MTELCTVDLLILDDFALEPMTRDESRDVYQMFVERNARASTIVTSNRDTADWLAAFDGTMLAQSAIDRLIDGESYRPRFKPNVEKDGPPPSAPVEPNPWFVCPTRSYAPSPSPTLSWPSSRPSGCPPWRRLPRGRGVRRSHG